MGKLKIFLLLLKKNFIALRTLIFRTVTENEKRCLLYFRESPLQSDEIMSSTSQKHRNFVSEPMGEKPVTDLSGIGEVLGKRLEEQGFDKAYVVLGQYLLLKKNDELFANWLKETCGANKKQQGDCGKCLKEWCVSFMSP